MRTVIAGGRDYQFTDADYEMLDWLHGKLPITEVVSGGARGADACGEEWAESRKVQCIRFPADWQKHGNRAGPIRNDQMAKFAQAVVLFPGGRGTDNMQNAAERHGCTVFDFREGLPELKEFNKPPKRKLTEEKVRAIRKRIREGAKLGEIAKDYGVSKVMVYKIKEYQTWVDV